MTSATEATRHHRFEEMLQEAAHKLGEARSKVLSTLEKDGKPLFNRLQARGRELEEKAEVQLKKIQPLLEDMAHKAEPVIEKAGERFEQVMVTVFHTLGLPHVDDIRKLSDRVDRLAKQVEDLHHATKPAAKVAAYHVVSHGGDWQVKSGGEKRAASTHGTKKEALAAARQLAQDHAPSRLVVHRKDGKVQSSRGYEPQPA